MVSRADNATKGLRKCGGTIRGIIRRAGIAAAIGTAEMIPADAGENPFASKILGSQSVKP
jgi:hypothetical protein